MPMTFSESERLPGGLHGPTPEGDNSAPPRRARSLPPRSIHPSPRGTDRGITGSSAASSGPAALHASGPLGLRFGPGDRAGSDRLAGDTEPGAMGGVTHRTEWNLRPQVRDSPTGARCPSLRMLAAAARLPEPRRRSLSTGRRGLSALPHSSSRGARWEAPNWTAGARHAGIPRAGFHSNQSTFSLGRQPAEKTPGGFVAFQVVPRVRAHLPPTPRGVKRRTRGPSACPVQESNGAKCSCEHSFIYMVIGRQTTPPRLF